MKWMVLAGTALGGCDNHGVGPGPLNVYAEPSLAAVFTDLEGVFEALYPGVDVAVTYAGSQALRHQIEQGATADVLATANDEHMRALADSGLVSATRIFAHNDLVVITPVDNPAGIDEFSDLVRAKRLVLGTENVPMGGHAREVLRHAVPTHAEGFARSEETTARLARAQIELGEADAAIVYRTDAGVSDGVRVVEIPREVNMVADYPIGVVNSTPRREASEAWVALVTSTVGRTVLERHGFILE